MKIRLLLVAIAALGLTACDNIDPNSPLGQRKALFKQMLRTSEDLGGMLRGRIPFNDKKFAEGAIKLNELAQKPWQHFPATREDNSSSRPEVWSKPELFKQRTEEFKTSTAALLEASRVQPLRAEALAAPVEQMQKTCRACHDEFRRY